MKKSPHYILGKILGIISVVEILAPDMVGALKDLRKDFTEYAEIDDDDDADKNGSVD